MIEFNIKKHLCLEPSGKYLTIEDAIGIKHLFQGWVVKCWRDMSERNKVKR